MPLLRRLFAVTAVVGLLAPTTAGLCAQQAARHCTQSSHDCCQGPRLSPCNCGAGHSTSIVAEPAQRHAPAGPDFGTLVVLPDSSPAVAEARFRSTLLESSPPHLAGRDRLTLFSILVV